MQNKIIELLNKYDFSINEINNYNNNQFIALGIGDILFTFTLILNHKIDFTIIFNLLLFDNEFLKKNHHEIWFFNPLNALEFRLELISNILKENNIEKNKIIFTFNNQMVTNSYYNLIYKLQINDYKLKINIPNSNIQIENNYIIFHTKCRFFKGFDYVNFKEQLKIFFKNFKTNKNIILLGERFFNQNWEGKFHNITTIYEELLILKENNNVIDMTIENINDNLNFEKYCKDIELIKNAYKNITFGFGGQLSTCLIFSIRNTFNFTDDCINCILDPNIFENKLYYKDLEYFFNIISE